MATTKITQVGKRIVNDSSLIFYYDMSNTARSFKGAPTTNLFAEDSDGVGGINRPPSATADFSQWDFTGTTYTEYLPNREVKIQENSTSTASRYLLLDSRGFASKDYTFSAYFKPLERKHIQIAPSTNFPQTSYANYTLEGEGTITGPGAAKATIKLMKTGSYTGWYRCTYTETSNATVSNNTRFALSLADTDSLTRLGSYAATSGYGVLIRDPQFEQTSFATPFVDGTRSNTGAIVDLTGNNTITATSLTYNNDNTFEFTSVDEDFMTFPYTQSDPNNFTLEAWIYHTAHSTDTNIGHTIMQAYGSVDGWIFGLVGTDSRLNLRQHNVNAQTQANVTYSTGLSLNTWYHVVAACNNTTDALYVNGEQVASQSHFTGTTGYGTCSIGAWGQGGATAGTNFAGEIPIVRIYHKGLSAAEVKQNFIAHRKQFGL